MTKRKELERGSIIKAPLDDFNGTIASHFAVILSSTEAIKRGDPLVVAGISTIYKTPLPPGQAERFRAGAGYEQPFLTSLIPGRAVKTFSRHTLRKRFRTACKKVLGAARLESLTIHHGRHTFISHALAGGRSLAEVRDVAGHCNVSITSGYLHVAVDDAAGVGSLFRFAEHSF